MEAIHLISPSIAHHLWLIKAACMTHQLLCKFLTDYTDFVVLMSANWFNHLRDSSPISISSRQKILVCFSNQLVTLDPFSWKFLQPRLLIIGEDLCISETFESSRRITQHLLPRSYRQDFFDQIVVPTLQSTLSKNKQKLYDLGCIFMRKNLVIFKYILVLFQRSSEQFFVSIALCRHLLLKLWVETGITSHIQLLLPHPHQLKREYDGT